jgi:hypothetical protein
VYEPLRTFDGLRRDQRLAVAPVRLALGDTIRWPLPMGLFTLTFNRTPASQPMPTIAVDGLIMCMPDFGPGIAESFCLVRAPGASVRISHPGTVAGAIVGSLAITRQYDPEHEPVSSSTEAIHASTRAATVGVRSLSEHRDSGGHDGRSVADPRRSASGNATDTHSADRDSEHAGGRDSPRVARRVQQR